MKILHYILADIDDFEIPEPMSEHLIIKLSNVFACHNMPFYRQEGRTLMFSYDRDSFSSDEAVLSQLRIIEKESGIAGLWLMPISEHIPESPQDIKKAQEQIETIKNIARSQGAKI